jgi:PAS domain S-box-containing protein
MSAANWKRYIELLPEHALVRPLVFESWQRSSAAGVPRDGATPAFRHVGGEELDRRLTAASSLIGAAAEHLAWIDQSLAGIRHVVYVTDGDGIVLSSIGDASLRSNCGLAPGHDWSEKTMGTNGAGTALACGRPVTIVGPEHFMSAFEDCTCTAAPIRDVDGTIVGAIDITTSVADGTPERLSLVAYAARMIERDLRHGRCTEEGEALRRMSERLEARQAELQAAYARLAFLCDNVPTLIYVVDENHRLLNANKSWGDLLGIPYEQVIGRSLYDLFPKEVAGQFAANNRLVLERGRAEFEETHNGRTYLSLKVPVQDEQGRNYAICGFSTEITERKATEDELRKSRAMLEDMDRRKDIFLAAVSHELRNPLASVKSGVAYLEQRMQADEQMQKACSLVIRNVDRTGRLLDDLLDVSRIIHGRLDLQMRELDLRRAVTDSARSVSVPIADRNQRLEMEIPAEALPISGDEMRLVQVFSNLLHNASKFTLSGGRISVRLGREGTDALVVVSDDGIGISDDALEHIFEPFWQSGQPGSKGGLGLGLYLTRNLVELHGGTVTAASGGLGTGSRFTVRLPLIGG